jgi:hypothetical protein
MLLRLALVSVIATTLTTSLLSAQSPAPPELIDELVANATLYNTTLPSITASETIESEASYLTIFRNKAVAKGTFRVVRDPNGGVLQESRHITELDGKPVAEGQSTRLPTTLFGGFGRFQEMFFTPSHRRCYTFTRLSEPGSDGSWQIAIAPRPADSAPPDCASLTPGATGVARIDPTVHQIVHLERTVPEEIAAKNHLAPFASVDIAPAKIGDTTFWLPTLVVGTFNNGKLKGRFVAHYSDYHRFTGSISLLPGVTEVDPQTPDTKPESARPIAPQPELN